MSETVQSPRTYLVVLDEVRLHSYDYSEKGDKPTDPGWHTCRCGWQGYWSDYQPHVAERVTAALMPDHKIHTFERSPHVADLYRCLVCGLSTFGEPPVWVESLTAPR